MINKKIFTVKNEEDNYKFENLNIECFSNNLYTNIFIIFFFFYIII